MKIFVIILLLPLTINLAKAQTNKGLDASFDVSFKNIPIETVLTALEKKSNLLFSYNSAIFNQFEKVTYNAKNKSTGDILNDILGASISFRAKGGYIILHKKGVSDPKDFILDGYIFDVYTKEKLIDVSIYEPISLAAAISNTNGYYKIKLRRNLDEIDLRISKEDYFKKKMRVPFRNDGRLNIGLTEKPQNSQTVIVSTLKNIPFKMDSVEIPKLDSVLEIKPVANVLDSLIDHKTDEKFSVKFNNKKDKFIDWLTSTSTKIHAKNVHDSINRAVQLSLLPFISTNGRLSSVVSNDFSFNIVSGISRNINKAEFGGFLNLVLNDATGAQFSGFGNVVGNNQSGVQMAGAVNINFGNSSGLVSAGFGNLNFKNSKGLLMAGAGNLTVNHKGVQMAGTVNISLDTLKGLQIAPFNIANTLRNGVQIGVFNLAYESINSLPIGFFSYVHKNGYRRLEVAYNDLKMPEISFKTGVQKFYNIFSIIQNTKIKALPAYGFGYGVGTSQKLGKSFSTDLNLTVSQFVPLDFTDTEELSNQLLNLSLSLEFKITKYLAIFAAPTFNYLRTIDDDFDFSPLKPRYLKTTSLNQWSEKSTQYQWLGFKTGVRLCNIR